MATVAMRCQWVTGLHHYSDRSRSPGQRIRALPTCDLRDGLPDLGKEDGRCSDSVAANADISRDGRVGGRTALGREQ